MDMPKLGLAVICLLLLSEFLMFQVLREIRWLEIELDSNSPRNVGDVLEGDVLETLNKSHAWSAQRDEGGGVTFTLKSSIQVSAMIAVLVAGVLAGVFMWVSWRKPPGPDKSDKGES